MPGRERKVGEFCWINMLTSRPEDAKAFFGELLGWTYGEIPGMGWFIEVGSSKIGGLFDLDGPNTPPGTPAGIGVMVKVDDADATGEKAKALGGSAKPAFDVGPPGRMAEIFATDGAAIDVWQPNQMPGTDVDAGLAGAPSWFETMTHDGERASRFYADLFGWTAEKSPNPAVDYTIFKLDGANIAGQLTVPADAGYPPPFWAVYFTVDDPDATAKKAVELGGQVIVPPTDIPAVGRFCALKSPQGVYFYTVHYTMVPSAST
ncbi:VOC family protein [Paludisphaera mucosa]|uniref:VOC family protein n=1 Tax=Paludisphaera mucosa TaxID=3030827 RepID=A0ABT6FEN6_9BACT|nr:VOC family protein [Paludisphaera mucosa]MDG3006035.1 VOC family protein [Paludisphaera mucosa]